ncbi:Uncharacterised protein [Mycobacteroides abscessus]|nr:Uncharacterised protein [Mycobacteroides abscessus]
MSGTSPSEYALPGRAGHSGHESAAGRNVRFIRCAASGTQSPVSGSRRISGPTYGCGVPSGPGTGAKRSGSGRGSSSRRVRSPETYAGESSK